MVLAGRGASCQLVEMMARSVSILYSVVMETKVTRRWQTVIPADIRHRYQIKAGDTLVWLDDGQMIRVVPVPADPLATLRGIGKSEGLTRKLLESRRADMLKNK